MHEPSPAGFAAQSAAEQAERLMQQRARQQFAASGGPAGACMNPLQAPLAGAGGLVLASGAVGLTAKVSPLGTAEGSAVVGASTRDEGYGSGCGVYGKEGVRGSDGSAMNGAGSVRDNTSSGGNKGGSSIRGSDDTGGGSLSGVQGAWDSMGDGVFGPIITNDPIFEKYALRLREKLYTIEYGNVVTIGTNFVWNSEEIPKDYNVIYESFKAMFGFDLHPNHLPNTAAAVRAANPGVEEMQYQVRA